MELPSLRVNTILFALLLFIGCKTMKNGYFKMPQNRYDIGDLRIQNIRNASPDDTFIMISINCSGLCTRGIEKDLFVFKKKGEVTKIERTSNLRKYKTISLTDTTIRWLNILGNIQLYQKDKIKECKITIEKDGSTSYQFGLSDGKTQQLDICFNHFQHNVYLGPGIEAFNINNMNLKLINVLSEIAYRATWVPIEKIRFKRER